MSYTTLWEIPDALWEMMERILPPEKPKGSRGRPALPNRQVVTGILFVLVPAAVCMPAFNAGMKRGCGRKSIE